VLECEGVSALRVPSDDRFENCLMSFPESILSERCGSKCQRDRALDMSHEDMKDTKLWIERPVFVLFSSWFHSYLNAAAGSGDVEEILSAVEDICCKSRAGVMQVARAAAERENGFPLPMRVAYHDACHLADAQGIRRQPRELLAAIPNLTLVPLAENEVYCGSAGIFN
jgi:cysteine-rich protein